MIKIFEDQWPNFFWVQIGEWHPYTMALLYGMNVLLILRHQYSAMTCKVHYPTTYPGLPSSSSQLLWKTISLSLGGYKKKNKLIYVKVSKLQNTIKCVKFKPVDEIKVLGITVTGTASYWTLLFAFRRLPHWVSTKCQQSQDKRAFAFVCLCTWCFSFDP